MNTLRDETLTLEPQTVAHAGEMFEVPGDPAIYEHENEPPASVEWLTRRFSRLEARQSDDGTEQWLNWIIRLSTGEPIGYVQATVHANARAGIAYELNSRHWHRGLASRAVSLMIDELNGRYRLRTLNAVLKRTNTRSKRLLARAGFLLASPELHDAFEAEADEWLMLRPARRHAAFRSSSGAGMLTFSPARADDFETLLELRIEAMRESLERIGRFDPARARERFLSGFSPDTTRHIEIDGQRIGFFVLAPHAQGLSLEHLYIRPAFQRRQIGGAVLAHVFVEADLQRSALRVGALRESGSNAFYVRHGFQLTEQGEFNNYYVRPRLPPEIETMPPVTSPRLVAESLVEFWSPRVVAEVDDAYVKVAKVKGSLAWHSHDDEDELFLILKGRLRIEMESGTVTLEEGEMFVVPKGVRHNPVADEECHLMLIERKSTLHTGNVVTGKTRSMAEQLRPV